MRGDLHGQHAGVGVLREQHVRSLPGAGERDGDLHDDRAVRFRVRGALPEERGGLHVRADVLQQRGVHGRDDVHERDVPVRDGVLCGERLRVVSDMQRGELRVRPGGVPDVLHHDGSRGCLQPHQSTVCLHQLSRDELIASGHGSVCV